MVRHSGTRRRYVRQPAQAASVRCRTSSDLNRRFAQCHEIAIGLVKHIAGNGPVQHVNMWMRKLCYEADGSECRDRGSSVHLLLWVYQGDITITPADQTVSLAIITGVQDTYTVHKSQVTYLRRYVATSTCYLLQLGLRPVAVVGRLAQE